MRYVLPAFLFAALPALAADDPATSVLNRLDTATQALATADSAGSNGQLKECFAPKGKNPVASDVIAQQVKDARNAFHAAFTTYLDTRPAYDALDKAFPYNMTHSEHVDADSICAAKPADAATAHDLAPKLDKATDAVRKACAAVVDAFDAFNKNYSGRLPKFAQYVPPHYASNCQESRVNVKSITNLLKQAAEDCTRSADEVSDSAGRLYTLDGRLQRGCEEARHDEDEYLDEKEKEHEAQRDWEQHHPIGAILCQGDPDCTKNH